ncbi:MAG: 3-deoxy-8-phosphooctulonate synthase [Candidatus Eisenbacteria sp.]|nr:3-deoxy-8-phosphooctulonate synthase [Candidatus Eisenbacteria bacterium]
MNPCLQVGGVRIGGGAPLVLIAGPCVLETEDEALKIAEKVRRLAQRLGMGYIFKASYTKDNRSSVDFFPGPGQEAGLRILEKVRREVGVPVLSDVHCCTEVSAAAEVLDILQIPAYLSQQTRLALAVGRTGKPVNVKKGQFVAPEDMRAAVGKIESTGNRNILLTERGSSFGYRTLVVDFRALSIMRALGYPVAFDVTHSVRIYGRPSKDPLGGEPAFIPFLARAGVGAGCEAVFLETHPEPARAACDASSMWPLERLEWLLEQLVRIDAVAREAMSREVAETEGAT